MTCLHCEDQGLIRIRYTDHDVDDFALCLCAAGQAWRHDRNRSRATNPLWHVWAAREQIAHSRIGRIEEWLDESELWRLFPGVTVAMVVSEDDLLLAAARGRRDM